MNLKFLRDYIKHTMIKGMSAGLMLTVSQHLLGSCRCCAIHIDRIQIIIKKIDRTEVILRRFDFFQGRKYRVERLSTQALFQVTS